MNKSPLISIIIPVYNVEKYLKECLNSVVNQTYANLEIILVNDGSTDKSPQICDEFALQDSRIKVFHQKNSGVSSARNKGLDSVSGDFITFVDSDDTIEKEHIQNMVNLLKDDTDIVCTPARKDLPEFEVRELSGIDGLKYILDERYFINFFKDVKFDWGNCNKLFKADIVKSIRFLPDEKVGEDFSFLWKAFLNSNKFIFGNKNTYNYRRSETSVMASKFDERHQTLLLVCDRFIEHVKNNDMDLLEEAYWIKARSLFDLIDYAKNDKNEKFVKKYSKELQKIQMKIYKNKNVKFYLKFLCFLHSNFYILLFIKRSIKERFGR